MDESLEIPLPGGNVTGAVRVGDTVRRATGPWTPSVHALLAHLQTVGFSAAPRVLGIDEQGREILTFIDGTPALRPWPSSLRQDSGLFAFAQLLADYHTAAASFAPPSGAIWRFASRPPKPGEIIRHGDYGPWNTIWREDKPVGLIDWDFAEPGPPLLDLALAAWYAVPLLGERGWQQAGFERPPAIRRRIEVLCEGYGASSVFEVLDAVEAVQRIDRVRMLTLGPQGVEPYAKFLATGERENLDEQMAWLAKQRATDPALHE